MLCHSHLSHHTRTTNVRPSLCPSNNYFYTHSERGAFNLMLMFHHYQVFHTRLMPCQQYPFFINTNTLQTSTPANHPLNLHSNLHSTILPTRQSFHIYCFLFSLRPLASTHLVRPSVSSIPGVTIFLTSFLFIILPIHLTREFCLDIRCSTSHRPWHNSLS